MGMLWRRSNGMPAWLRLQTGGTNLNRRSLILRRNKVMSTERASLVNKLILLVLVLILACLVILIARQNVGRKGEAPPPVAETVAEEASAPASPKRSQYLPLTNRAAQ